MKKTDDKTAKKQQSKEIKTTDKKSKNKDVNKLIEKNRKKQTRQNKKEAVSNVNSFKSEKSKKDKEVELIRLNKYISNAGYCSRREADELIKAGAVSVDGEIITELGYKIKPTSVVKIGGEILRREKLRYILLNKPKDYITTCYDPRKRKTVMELIKGACKERVYPVGRLDRNSTGLLLLTNDGDLARKIMHPSSKIKKLYEVTLDKPITQEILDEIAKGVYLDGDFVPVDDVAFVENSKTRKVVGIELHSGKYHVVKRIFEKFGFKVIKLDRTRIDCLTKKNLPRGRWRFLTDSEVQLLKRF